MLNFPRLASVRDFISVFTWIEVISTPVEFSLNEESFFSSLLLGIDDLSFVEGVAAGSMSYFASVEVL